MGEWTTPPAAARDVLGLIVEAHAAPFQIIRRLIERQEHGLHVGHLAGPRPHPHHLGEVKPLDGAIADEESIADLVQRVVVADVENLRRREPTSR